jgi:nanoRNase/pAp phosphatase (c-di-AMP/oligoRNAs hydrolase)
MKLKVEKGSEMMKDIEKKIMEGLEGHKAAIWMAGPDPDAIGSAVGLQWLLKQKGIVADIWYSGVISHPQNRTMVNLLNVKLSNALEDDYDADSYKTKFCVDCTPKNINFPKNIDGTIDVIIDHHPKNLKSEEGFLFVDMRSTGSCGAIIYDWIKHFDLAERLGDDEEGVDVSTSILLAVFNDTDSLTSEDIQALDFEAYQSLHKYCDISKFKNTLAYPIPKYFLDVKMEAMRSENTHTLNTTHISCVGYLSANRRDILAQISDENVRLEGISTSIVFGIIDGNLEGCCRSSDVALNLHAFTQSIFGKEFSGGKFSKSAGKVPLGFLRPDENTGEELRGKILEAVKAKVLSLIEKEVG